MTQHPSKGKSSLSRASMRTDRRIYKILVHFYGVRRFGAERIPMYLSEEAPGNLEFLGALSEFK